MAVQSGAYKHPNTTTYSQGMRDVIDACLKVDSRDRPDIYKVRSSLSIQLVRNRDLIVYFFGLQLIEMTDAVLRTLS